MGDLASSNSPRLTTAQVLGSGREKILSAWESRVRREIPSLQDIEAFALFNSLPKLLDRISLLLENDDTELTPLRCHSIEHAECRARIAHYSMGQISIEYRFLRKAIFEFFDATKPLSAQERNLILDAVSESLELTSQEFCRIEEQKSEAAHKMAASLQERYENVVNHLSHAIAWLYDPVEMRFIFVTKQAEKILGFPMQAWFSETNFLRQLLGAEDQAVISRAFEVAQATNREEVIEHRIKASDSRELWFQTSIQAEKDGFGNIICFRGLCFEITQRKKVEAENLHLLKLSKMDLDRLREEREMREHFVNALTHDLRNPLAGVKLTAQLLMREENTENVKNKAKRIIGGINRVDRMVSDLLDANRIRAGQNIPLKLGRMDICELVREVAGDFSLLHGPRFHLLLPEEATGIWSREGIRRILENLMSNALKYGSKSTQIIVSVVRATDGGVELLVHNEGNEIAAEDQARLFELFHRSRSARSGNETGWGIGLTLVRGLAIAMGGTIAVSSKPSEGTTFTLRLPKASSGVAEQNYLMP